MIYLTQSAILRSLLLITTRINQNPRDGIILFQQVLATAKLPTEERKEVERWVQELSRWADEKSPASKDPFVLAEKLISSGAATTPDTFQNDVAILRGTGILHQQLESGSVPATKRPRALYLLGYAYSHLSLYFAGAWAEMHLERCILEFPGTSEAQRAYKLYRDIIVDDYTGTAGTSIPDEVKLHLEELRKKAHGEPGFSGVVQSPAGAASSPS